MGFLLCWGWTPRLHGCPGKPSRPLLLSYPYFMTKKAPEGECPASALCLSREPLQGRRWSCQLSIGEGFIGVSNTEPHCLPHVTGPSRLGCATTMYHRQNLHLLITSLAASPDTKI